MNTRYDNVVRTIGMVHIFIKRLTTQSNGRMNSRLAVSADLTDVLRTDLVIFNESCFIRLRET